MHILYLDDSGSADNASDKHFILAGISAFERRPHWLSQQMEQLAQRAWPSSPEGLEFRGSDIRSGRKHWRGLAKADREQVFLDALGILATEDREVRLFGAVIHKAAISPDDPVERAFEQICNRFDRYLGRLHKGGNTQRGLIVLDESSKETALQGLSRDFRTIGHRWGQLYNLAEVPLFVDSRATRMIQFADLIAYALRRYYENGEARYFDVIKHRFDATGGVVHGLHHFTPTGVKCGCYACL